MVNFLPHLRGLPHLPGVPHLHVNRPLVTFRPKHPKRGQNLQTTSIRVTFVWESPRGSKSPCSTWFFVRSIITVSWEYWLCFTQFRLRWMTGFMVRSNGALVILVYFYQLGNGVNFHTFLLTYIFLLSLKMHDSNLKLKVYYLRALTSLLIGCDTNGALDSGLYLGVWNLKLTTPDWKKQSVKGRNLLTEISLKKVFKFVRKCGLLISGR